MSPSTKEKIIQLIRESNFSEAKFAELASEIQTEDLTASLDYIEAAIESQNIKCIALLVENNARMIDEKISAPQEAKFFSAAKPARLSRGTALHIAAKIGNMEAMRYLILNSKAAIDPNVPDLNNKTAFDIAETHAIPAVKKTMLEFLNEAAFTISFDEPSRKIALKSVRDLALPKIASFPSPIPQSSHGGAGPRRVDSTALYSKARAAQKDGQEAIETKREEIASKQKRIFTDIKKGKLSEESFEEYINGDAAKGGGDLRATTGYHAKDGNKNFLEVAIESGNCKVAIFLTEKTENRDQFFKVDEKVLTLAENCLKKNPGNKNYQDILNHFNNKIRPSASPAVRATSSLVAAPEIGGMSL